MNTILLGIAAITFYLLATLLLFLRIRSIQNSESAPSNGYLFPGCFAILLHLLLLCKLSFIEGELNLNFAASFTLFTWFITVISLFFSLRMKLPALFLILFPFNTITIVGALLLHTQAIHTDTYSIALIVHILLSLLAYSLLSIASLIAVLIAIQDFHLHHHQQSFLLKQLPALQTLEALMFRLIEIGFLLLSFSVISGFIFTDDLMNHKIVFSIIAWCVFLVLLLGRHIAGWRGQTAIRWTLTGIAALMLAIFGTKIVLEFILT